MGIESQIKRMQAQRSAKKPSMKKAPKESKDPNRRFLKSIILNYFQSDAAQIRYQTEEVINLLSQLQECMRGEATLLEIEAPIFVCGDIHGQLTDLRRIFHIAGFPSRKRFLFLGDYVDRGQHSLEVMCTLAAMKLLFPTNVFLLRGNHELSHINKEYGFLDEVKLKWIDPREAERVYAMFNDTFAYFPLAAVISGKILCMHGGLSPQLTSLAEIRDIPRPISSPKGMAQDLLWADPQHDCDGFRKNVTRACSFNFGEREAHSRLARLGVTKMIRAHQVVQFGWEMFAGGSVITVFSACRYQEDSCNYGAIIDVRKNLGIAVIMIKPSECIDMKNFKCDEPPTVDGKSAEVQRTLPSPTKTPTSEKKTFKSVKDSEKRRKAQQAGAPAAATAAAAAAAAAPAADLLREEKTAPSELQPPESENLEQKLQTAPQSPAVASASRKGSGSE